MFIESNLLSKSSDYKLPENYEIRRNTFMDLLQENNFIATDPKAGGLQILQAVKNNYPFAVAFLIDYGYKANVRDENGQTPFNYVTP